MELRSSSFAPEDEIPSEHALDGANCSPPLEFSEVPEGTQSLMLVMEDIDCPIGVFTHWLVWNIPADVREIDAGELPPSAEIGLNGFGEVGYSGPCPPSGRHRYRFVLLALGCTLEAATSDRRDQVEAEAEGQVLARAELTGLYTAAD